MAAGFFDDFPIPVRFRFAGTAGVASRRPNHNMPYFADLSPCDEATALHQRFNVLLQHLLPIVALYCLGIVAVPGFLPGRGRICRMQTFGECMNGRPRIPIKNYT